LPQDGANITCVGVYRRIGARVAGEIAFVVKSFSRADFIVDQALQVGRSDCGKRFVYHRSLLVRDRLSVDGNAHAGFMTAYLLVRRKGWRVVFRAGRDQLTALPFLIQRRARQPPASSGAPIEES
jgi:hypothetical protein